MQHTTSRARVPVIITIALALGLSAVIGGSLSAQESAADTPLLEGVWIVQVQVRDCVSQNPLGPPFQSLVTFHEGGTLSESTSSPAFAVGQRADATGLWTRLGARTYLQRVAALIRFTTAPNPPVSPGFEAGGQTITQTIELVDSSHFRSSGTNAFYRTGEFTPYRTGCSTTTGVRF